MTMDIRQKQTTEVSIIMQVMQRRATGDMKLKAGAVRAGLEPMIRYCKLWCSDSVGE